ncbi:hypothetical protein NL676_000024 [Syzygium grande]|nr:hypothetical protein NL676_000024 [Syzygium grande]
MKPILEVRELVVRSDAATGVANQSRRPCATKGEKSCRRKREISLPLLQSRMEWIREESRAGELFDGGGCPDNVWRRAEHAKSHSVEYCQSCTGNALKDIVRWMHSMENSIPKLFRLELELVQSHIVKQFREELDLVKSDFAGQVKEVVREISSVLEDTSRRVVREELEHANSQSAQSLRSSGKCRRKGEVSPGYCESIREAVTEAFTVKENRGKSYKKHYPPASDDEVWRLANIAKDGPSHKKLNEAGIYKVDEFLRQHSMDSKKLRNILGKGMTDKKWKVLLDHAKTCTLDGKFYVYYRDFLYRTRIMQIDW